jgi:hypothetical protein
MKRSGFLCSADRGRFFAQLDDPRALRAAAVKDGLQAIAWRRAASLMAAARGAKLVRLGFADQARFLNRASDLALLQIGGNPGKTAWGRLKP